MDFLSKEIENLLQECIDRSDDFPAVLAEKFEGLSAKDDNQLRSCIKVLIDEGYISKLSWGSNVPYYGRIEQKGYDYCRQKEIYIRAKLRQDPYFTLLDDESETALRELSQSSEMFITVSGNSDKGRVLEHLNRYGYIQLGSQGLSYDFSGNFTTVVSIMQKGKNYFADKSDRIEEIMVLGDEAFVVNNIDKQFNVSGNTISNSPIQVGDGNTQSIDYSDVEKRLGELKEEVNYFKLSDEQIKTLSSLIQFAEKECKSKNSSKLKIVLNELWDFTKQTGSNLLAAFVAYKFGFGV